MKRDMPADLVSPVQSYKGTEREADLDAEYWEAFKTLSARKLLLLDFKILVRALRVQLEHRGL